MNARWLENRWLQLGARMLLGIVFICAGATKMMNSQPFADSIASFRLLPQSAINLLALGLPPFEIAVGGLLLVGWRLRAASLGVLAMLIVFLTALGSAMIRKLPVDCGCFGVSGNTAQGWLLMVRDLALAVVAGVVYWWVGAHRSPGGGKTLDDMRVK